MPTRLDKLRETIVNLVDYYNELVQEDRTRPLTVGQEPDYSLPIVIVVSCDD